MIEDLFVETGSQTPHPSFQTTIPPSVGAYVGEVFIRSIRGEWSVHPEYGEGVDLGDDRWVFPTAKAAKRFANGREDNLAFYGRTILERFG